MRVRRRRLRGARAGCAEGARHPLGLVVAAVELERPGLRQRHGDLGVLALLDVLVDVLGVDREVVLGLALVLQLQRDLLTGLPLDGLRVEAVVVHLDLARLRRGRRSGRGSRAARRRRAAAARARLAALPARRDRERRHYACSDVCQAQLFLSLRRLAPAPTGYARPRRAVESVDD